MNPIRCLLGVAAASLLLAACAGAPEAAASPTPAGKSAAPVGTGAAPTPPPTGSSPAASPAVEAAVSALASALNLPPSQIRVVSADPHQWPDGCLGLPGEGEMCAMHVVPGYRVVLQAGGATYTYRTDQVGDEVRAENPAGTPGSPQTPAGAAAPGAVKLPPAVLDRLAALLKLTPADLKVVQAESVLWRDGCLGVSTPGMMCAQVITPGYRVVVSAGGKQYEFHTDQSGSAIRQAPPAAGS